MFERETVCLATIRIRGCLSEAATLHWRADKATKSDANRLVQEGRTCPRDAFPYVGIAVEPTKWDHTRLPCPKESFVIRIADHCR